MSPEAGRRGGTARRHGLAFAVLGAAVASVGWLVVVVSVTMTPGEAESRRAAPVLPPPVVAVESKVLRQMTWYDCDRHRASVPVKAPPVPPTQRSVVTALAAARRVHTGTLLVRVADRRVLAVVTDGVFYRDLTPGLRGPDVLAFTRALREAGLVASAGDIMDAHVLAAWSRVDPAVAGTGEIPWRSLVAVPTQAEVGAVRASRGQDVRAGETLLEVSAADDSFTCQVPDEPHPPDPDRLALEIAGREVRVASVTLGKAVTGAPGPWVVTPTRELRANVARLRLEHGDAGDDPVLTVPLQAIRTTSSGDTAVVVVDGSTQREVAVALGATAQGWVSIRGKGVVEGAQVRLYDEGSS